jgi:hypothetical protein
MIFLPCLAKFGDLIQELCLNVVNLMFWKTEILPQTQWAAGQFKLKMALLPCPMT